MKGTRRSKYHSKRRHRHSRRHSAKHSRRNRYGGGTLAGPIIASQGPYNGNVYRAFSGNGSMYGGCYGRKKKGTKRRRYHVQKGGYNQFQSNLPMTNSYSTGGSLKPSDIAMANPVPYQPLSNCTNCIDNFDLNSKQGFQFWSN
jgi:hypothetical protein